jgi:integrase
MSIAKVKTAQGAVKWEVRLKPRGRGSKEIRRRFDKKRDAEDFEDEIRSQTKELDRTGFSGDVMEQRVFSEEADYWLLANQYKFSASHKKRVEGVLKEILPKFGRYCLKRFNPGLLVDFQHQQMKLGKSPSTVNRKTEVITAILNHSMRHRRIPYNPPSGFTKLKAETKEMSFWEKHEAVDFLKSMNELHPKESETRWRYLVYLLALNTGMRAGEIWGLFPKDFSRDGHSIFVVRQYNRVNKKFGQTKGKNTRHVPLNDHLKNELYDLIEKDGIGQNEPVFKSEDGPAKNHDSFIHRFQSDLKAWGGRQIRFHDLRHTATTLMLASGTDLKTVKEVCGHKDISTTMNYIHMLGESVAKLSRTFNLNPFENEQTAEEVIPFKRKA